MLYEWLGDGDVLVPPSPKLHAYEYGDEPPEAPPVNLTFSGAGPEVGVADAEQFNALPTVMLTVFEQVADLESVTVNVATYEPVLLYVWLGEIDMLDVPSPNVHLYEYGDVPPEAFPLKFTVRGAVPDVGPAETAQFNDVAAEALIVT